MFKKLKILLFFLILIIIGFIFYIKRIVIKEYFFGLEKIELPEETKFNEIQNTLINKDEIKNIVKDNKFDIKNEETEDVQIEEINSSSNLEFTRGVNLDVPFTIQSPNQKWDEPYKEGCEEASVLMVYSFLKNKEITIKSALKDINALVDWQIENYEGHFNLSASSTAYMSQKFFNLSAELINLKTIRNLKDILRTGYPLILPCAGQKLKNPNFKPPGPLYHMLVAKGFKDNLIITNDPGTRKGKNYIYDQNVLWNAIADWNEEAGNCNQNLKIVILLR